MELYKTLEKVAKESGIQTLTTKINAITKPFFEKKGFTILENIVKSKNGKEIIVHTGIKNISEI